MQKLTESEIKNYEGDIKLLDSLAVSETLVVGIDMAKNQDLSAVTVARICGNKHEIINTFYGEAADIMYALLCTNLLNEELSKGTGASPIIHTL